MGISASFPDISQIGSQVVSGAEQALGNAVSNLTGYATGLVESYVSTQLQQVSMSVPSNVLGIVSAIFQDTSSDPLQNLMYSVSIGGQTFKDGMIQGVDVPTYQIKTRTQRQAGRLAFYPSGEVSVDPLTIHFMENRDGDVSSLWDKAVSAVYNRGTGHYKAKATWAKDIHVSLLGFGSSDEVIGFTFYSCTPVSQSQMGMSLAGGQFVKVTQRWQADYYAMSVQGNTVTGQLLSAASNIISSSVNKAISFIGL